VRKVAEVDRRAAASSVKAEHMLQQLLPDLDHVELSMISMRSM
jgi:hypothetical protein